jgi:hypothetical protein
VLQKPAEELGAGESHGALLVVIGIILPAEPDLGIGDGENPMVGDGDAMRITSGRTISGGGISGRGFMQ